MLWETDENRQCWVSEAFRRVVAKDACIEKGNERCNFPNDFDQKPAGGTTWVAVALAGGIGGRAHAQRWTR